MQRIYSVLWFGLVIFFDTVHGQEASRICATTRFETECSQLQRGNSEVICEPVQDSIQCAQKLRNGTADFGIFTSESSLQLASLGWSDLTVIKELRHRDRMGSAVDFETVVIVRASYEGGTEGLRGSAFCHPGYHYDRTQRWTERVLKHFERSVVMPNCDSDLKSPAEIETAALASFFKSACRPGTWSNNKREDAELKSKYPQLCSLCNSEENTNCSYGTPGNNHQQALNCLIHGGDVTYVSLEDAHNFFFIDNPDTASYYNFLCPNGTKQPITDNAQPCTWLRQPWKLIISSNPNSLPLSHKVNYWMRSSAIGIWETAVKDIIQADNFFVNDATIQAPRDYFRLYRDIPIAISLCSTNAVWCTTSLEEHEKCEVVRAGGVTSGVYPIIECREPATSVVSCLADVSAGRADLMGIDSNFGFLARHTYNLTAAMYAETENAKYSSVVAVIKATSSYERFENLRNSRACFAEFGGIALMAFINTGKSRGFFSKNECNYGRLLSNYFGSSCAPGATDFGHDPTSANSENLCSLCRTMVIPIQPIITIAPPEAPTINPPPPTSLITIAPPGSLRLGEYNTKSNQNASDDEGNVTEEAPEDVTEEVEQVPRPEETQNATGDSGNLIELEEGVSNIDVSDGKIQASSQPFTYAGAIKKTNRKSSIGDVAGSCIRKNPKAIFNDRPQLQEISNQILKGIKVMIIMRGAPGSGKSYLAKEIINATTCDDYSNHIFGSDDYFYDERGQYQFSQHRHGEVHESNRQRVNYYASRSWSPIVVDNTNMKVREMKPYFDIAVRCGYLVHLLEANNTWSQSSGKLVIKNSHGVPKETIERMLNAYEPATVSSVMESYGLNYAMAMPQYRLFPPISPTSNSTQLNNTSETADETIDLIRQATQVHKNCNADETNRFYGNRGALRCLHEEGDVAIIELQYLREHATALGLNEHDFRIICRNGTLADRTGFDVDEACALTTIVDNEIVVRPKSDKIPGIINALNSFDKYFSLNPDFKMYNVYNGYEHLLFKDSTIGVVSYQEDDLGPTVQNYKTLFSNLEE